MVTPSTILIVEDEPSFGQALGRWLEMLGHDSLLVGTAEEAASVYAARRFKSILLDLHLPGRSGHVFLRQLCGVNSQTPVIVISGGAQMDDVILALRNGAADFLRKPFRIDELAQALARATDDRSALNRLLSLAKDVALPTPELTAAPGTSGAAAPAPEPARAVAVPIAERTLPSRPRTVQALLEQIRRGVASLPVLDSQVGRIAQLLSAPEVDTEELLRLVESDAYLTTTLLRSANSAYYSRGTAVKGIRDAFTRLGSRSVLNLVTGAALQARLRVSGPFAEVARAQWRNSFATSRFCGEIAKSLRHRDAERLQLLGLIHNLGEQAFVYLVSDLELGLDGVALAQEMSNVHEQVGLALVRSWKMSPDVCRIVGSHHQADPRANYDLENERFIVLAAWNLAIKCGFSYLPEQQCDPSEPLAELGLTEEALAAVCADSAQWTFD